MTGTRWRPSPGEAPGPAFRGAPSRRGGAGGGPRFGLPRFGLPLSREGRSSASAYPQLRGCGVDAGDAPFARMGGGERRPPRPREEKSGRGPGVPAAVVCGFVGFYFPEVSKKAR